MTFRNVYEDQERAMAYAKLDFPGSYYLAYRDLADIFTQHVRGKLALDFGCGAGRSTRFLQGLGFCACGLDISPDMIAQAQQIDPHGEYHLVPPGNFYPVSDKRFDLIQAIFTFDNIAGVELKIDLLKKMANLLQASGRLVILVSRPEIYTHEWASFSTCDFPGNGQAQDGDTVYTIITDTTDRRPVADILCSDASYRRIFASAGLAEEAQYCPLGREDEKIAWVNETHIAPWSIYVLKKISA